MVTPGMLNRRAQLFEQLAAMIAAGVPLTRAMELVARNRSTGIPQKTLQALTAHLQEGHTFTDAMQLVSGQKRVVNNGGLEVTLKPGRKAYALSEFDVALLSCGSYATALGDFVRHELGKKAVYLGGMLNVMFNIYGERYDTPFFDSLVNLDTRIDALENDELASVRGGRGLRNEAMRAYFGRAPRR